MYVTKNRWYQPQTPAHGAQSKASGQDPQNLTLFSDCSEH